MSTSKQSNKSSIFLWSTDSNFASWLTLFIWSCRLQLPEEEDYDLSDVDLDDDLEKDELWAQMGRDLIQTATVLSGQVWSCVTRLPSPVDEWGCLVAQLLKYSRKDTWETPAVSHIIFVSHTGEEGGGGRGEVCLCRVPGVNSASHTCWTLEVAYLYNLRQLSGRGVNMNVSELFIHVFIKHHFPPSSSAPLKHLF